ncbi:3-oxoacyl-[acyl-carrier-protein] reductase FabG [Delftia tsuruhatensis]|uniref:SDR family NAD(P)-dependent oxidoreductase n=1 Tax=Delftia tsuruhatensis TaxID=180282 RepID=UPI001E6B4D22|nr:SDR family NAD(P)-dependent oxidoreductase [Delftia tsuruhatensis]CAB5690228.1 3-oxoacyl-[acyl-carrier-protein] reductase FabG [Delftia tsuruhatensis]CAC9677056.1 3-oxoacyl-[acyl-carrier-protein] reductase FabG [Delftia tsuruhatensis]
MSTHKDKGIALITGASSGIGAVYAERLAARGHDLILVARREDRLQALAQRLRADHGREVQVVAADLAETAGLQRVEALLSGASQVDMVVNCAGLGALGPAAQVDAGEVDRLVMVNIHALTRLSLAAARLFAARGRGTLVNIGSILAVMPVPGAASYSASKAYVLGFTRSLQAELAPRGVTVQAVMPSLVRSEFFGGKPAPFPEHLFMSPETLVDTALTALDQGEAICFPTLQDMVAWQDFDASRARLVTALTQGGTPAARYRAAEAAVS